MLRYKLAHKGVVSQHPSNLYSKGSGIFVPRVSRAQRVQLSTDKKPNGEPDFDKFKGDGMDRNENWVKFENTDETEEEAFQRHLRWQDLLRKKIQDEEDKAKQAQYVREEDFFYLINKKKKWPKRRQRGRRKKRLMMYYRKRGSELAKDPFTMADTFYYLRDKPNPMRTTEEEFPEILHFEDDKDFYEIVQPWEKKEHFESFVRQQQQEDESIKDILRENQAEEEKKAAEKQEGDNKGEATEDTEKETKTDESGDNQKDQTEEGKKKSEETKKEAEKKVNEEDKITKEKIKQWSVLEDTKRMPIRRRSHYFDFSISERLYHNFFISFINPDNQGYNWDTLKDEWIEYSKKSWWKLAALFGVFQGILYWYLIGQDPEELKKKFRRNFQIPTPNSSEIYSPIVLNWERYYLSLIAATENKHSILLETGIIPFIERFSNLDLEYSLKILQKLSHHANNETRGMIAEQLSPLFLIRIFLENSDNSNGLAAVSILSSLSESRHACKIMAAHPEILASLFLKISDPGMARDTEISKKIQENIFMFGANTGNTEEGLKLLRSAALDIMGATDEVMNLQKGWLPSFNSGFDYMAGALIKKIHYAGNNLEDNYFSNHVEKLALKYDSFFTLTEKNWLTLLGVTGIFSYLWGRWIEVPKIAGISMQPELATKNFKSKYFWSSIFGFGVLCAVANFSVVDRKKENSEKIQDKSLLWQHYYQSEQQKNEIIGWENWAKIQLVIGLGFTLSVVSKNRFRFPWIGVGAPILWGAYSWKGRGLIGGDTKSNL